MLAIFVRQTILFLTNTIISTEPIPLLPLIEDHDAWQQRKDERKKQSKSQQSEQPATQKLTMPDKLKTALLTKCKLSASELDALVEGSK